MDEPNERRLQRVRKLVERAGCRVDSTKWRPLQTAAPLVNATQWRPLQAAGLLGWSTPEAEILLCAMSPNLVEPARARIVTVLGRHGWRESAMTWTYEQIALERYRLTLRLPIDQATAGRVSKHPHIKRHSFHKRPALHSKTTAIKNQQLVLKTRLARLQH